MGEGPPSSMVRAGQFHRQITLVLRKSGTSEPHEEPAIGRLIQPDQEYRSFGGLRRLREFFGAGAVVVEHPDAHPPVAHRAAKTEYFSAVVAALQVAGEIAGRLLFFKGTNLHRPSPASIQRSRRF